MPIDTLKSARNRLLFARLDPNLPAGIHEPKCHGDVGWDLEAMEDVWIPPMEAVDVPVNARIALPQDCWAEIRPRSSISRRNLQVDAGTIDNGYRGPLYVLVRNMQLPTFYSGYNGIEAVGGDPDPNGIQIQRGERIGQLVFYHVAMVWAEEVPEIDTDTHRGENGFGSTGR